MDSNEMALNRKGRQEALSTATRAAIDIFPLCAAVIPWGVLCGSLAIQVGLTPFQAQALSLFVFAGAAQLAAISLIGAGSPSLPILSSTFVISSRHLLYSAVFHGQIKNLPWHKRVIFAFFLTDEMFALTNDYIAKHRTFNYLYAVSSGITFYVMWNLATLAGIAAGQSIHDLEALGLEFAIAATFIAIVIPSIKDKPTFASVVASGLTVVVLETLKFEYSLIAATMVGMVTGYVLGQKGESHDV